MLNQLISKSFFCICLCVFQVAGLSYAQSEKINFTSITSKHGLSSNIVNAILKDSQGIMWFATEDGLNKYDGTTVTVYRYSDKNPNSLPVNDVISLHEDKFGNIWVGTNGGSAVIYDRKTDGFKDIKSLPGFEDRNNVIRAIASDYLGRVWISNFAGISVIDIKTKKVLDLSGRTGQPGLSIKNVSAIFEDSKRRMWVGSDDGLFLYNRKGNSFFHYRNSAGDPNSLVGNRVRSITEDINGTIWIATEQGLSMLLPSGKGFRNFKHIAGDANSLSSNEVFSAAPDSEGKLWLGTEEGLNILDVKSLKISVYKPNHRDNHSLKAKVVRCVYIDKHGIYWLGTFKGGVNKYDTNLSLFNLKESDPYDPKGLTASFVTSFAEGEKGQVFVGTDGGGLNLFDRRTELFSRYSLQSAVAPAKNLSILALQMSREKQLWVGTYANGLFQFDPKTGRYQQYIQGAGRGALTNNNVFCLEEDSKGNIWIGTNGGGVNVYHPRSRTFSNYHQGSAFSEAVNLQINSYIRTIIEDNDGNIWIGSHGSGLSVLNPRTNTAQHFDRGNSKLPANVVLSIFSDKQHNIWVGTLGGGLSLFDKKAKQFISFSEKAGLANAVVYKILEDDAGLLWMSTNSGISSFDRKTKRFRNYNQYNGVQNSNFTNGAGLKLSTGELYFGGLEGFNYFFPKDIKTHADIPSVLLTELKVDNRSIVPSEESPLKEHISIAKDINLNYEQNFSLAFVALSYTVPQQYRYSYMLEGFDKTWNHVGAAKIASYTNIDPGEYVFKVRVSDADGNDYGKMTKVNIHVKPPFWLTIYAYIFYVLALLALLLYIRFRGIRKLKRDFRIKQEKMEAIQLREQERKEAERLHDLDMLKIKFLTNLSHEFRTPISLIMGPIETLMADKRYQSAEKHLFIVKRNARRLLNLVNQLLDFRKMEEHELRLNLSEGDIVAFVKEVSDSFRDMSERKNISFVLQMHLDRFYTSFDHDKIERVLFNLLSNAFKFTPGGGAIKIELDRDQQDDIDEPWIIIKVTDTGIGISADKKEKIFERFFQNNTAESILNQGSGIGLSITKEFVKMHGGTIDVESEPDKGSSFIIRFPFSAIDVKDVVAEEMVESEEPLLPVEVSYETERKEPVASTWEGTDENEVPTVLLVEDNDDFRFYLKDNLKSFYRVYEATNGKEGWQKTLSLHPQIIVSDVNMPFVDGIEFCRKVKSDKRTSHTPIILLTALTGEGEQIKGLETGANDYMTKPFNFEILNAKIRNLLILNSTLKNAYTKQIKVQAPELHIESHGDRLLNKVVLYIEENINNPKLSVEDLSRHVGMSRGSLYHKILELTGMSPVEYIRSVKLDKAAVLLEKSDLNVAQIAYMVGFATPNYFAKSFKAKFNMQPSEFMALKRKGSENKSK